MSVAPFNGTHLRRVLSCYFRYYHRSRGPAVPSCPHQKGGGPVRSIWQRRVARQATTVNAENHDGQARARQREIDMHRPLERHVEVISFAATLAISRTFLRGQARVLPSSRSVSSPVQRQSLQAQIELSELGEESRRGPRRTERGATVPALASLALPLAQRYSWPAVFQLPVMELCPDRSLRGYEKYCLHAG
jgi:hypothetical protein